MDLFLSERFVFFFCIVLGSAALIFTALFKHRLTPLLAVIFIAYGMFGYTVIPLFAPAEARFYWFKVDPPPAVSRITVLSLFALCLLAIWRAREVVARAGWTYPLLALAISISPLVATLISAIAPPQVMAEPFSLNLKFAVWFAAFCLLACVASIATLGASTREQDTRLLTGASLLLGGVITIAFFEVAYDLGPVKNFFRGHVEIRASSTFHNPNWFGLAVAPSAFLACHAMRVGRKWFALGLFSLCSLGLILSGSRSAIALTVLALAVFAFANASTRDAAFRSTLSIAAIGMAGASIGGLAGLLGSTLVRGVATDRYVALLERVLGWPLYLFSDEQALVAARGRFAAGPGSSVVDNAYVFWIQQNSAAGGLLILIMGSVMAMAIRHHVKRRTFESALGLSMAVFVVGGGMIGQVYWAYPVWPIFAILLGCVLRPIAQDIYAKSRSQLS